MLLSINQLSELTEIDRRTVAASLKDLPFVAGEKNAYLYHAAKALPVLYRADNLEAARAKQALSQASLNAVREEDLRRERIPRQIVKDAFDETFQAIGATLKAAENKVLTPELINELFDKFRADPEQWT